MKTLSSVFPFLRLVAYWLAVSCLGLSFAYGFHIGWMSQAFSLSYAGRIQPSPALFIGAGLIACFMPVLYAYVSLCFGPLRTRERLLVMAAYALMILSVPYGCGRLGAAINTTYDVVAFAWKNDTGLSTGDAILFGEQDDQFILVPYDRTTNTIITNVAIHFATDDLQVSVEHLGHPHKRVVTDVRLPSRADADLQRT